MKVCSILALLTMLLIGEPKGFAEPPEQQELINLLIEISKEFRSLNDSSGMAHCPLDYDAIRASMKNKLQQKYPTWSNDAQTFDAGFMGLWQDSQYRKYRTAHWYNTQESDAEDLFLNDALDCISPNKTCKHEEYPKFKVMINQLHKDPGSLWKKLIEGFKKNKDLYNKCRIWKFLQTKGNTDITHACLTQKLSLKDNTDTRLAQLSASLVSTAIKECNGSDSIPFINSCNESHTLNYENIPELKEFAEEVNGGLKPSEGEVGLWSGGITLSEYATQKDHVFMLETSPVGSTLNTMFLKASWPGINVMWNSLSEKYTEHLKAQLEENSKKPVHIYLRTFDPNGVLFRQELPTLLSGKNVDEIKNNKNKIKMHILFGADTHLTNLCLKGDGEQDSHVTVCDYSYNDAKARYAKFLIHSIKKREYRTPMSYISVCALQLALLHKDVRAGPNLSECQTIENKLCWNNNNTSECTIDSAYQLELEIKLNGYLKTDTFRNL